MKPNHHAWNLSLWLVSIVALVVFGCSGADAQMDEEAESATSALSIAPAPVAQQYYAVTRDARLCPSPLCGGYWVKAVNLSATRCADGTVSPQCYVTDIDWKPMGADPNVSAATVVIQGSLVLRSSSTFGKLGVLVAKDAWGSATAKTPSGQYYRLKDLGIACIAAPCFSIAAELLNTSTVSKLSALDLTPAGASDEQVKAAYAALGQGRLLAAGALRYTPYPTGTGVSLVASQFFLPEVRCYSDSNCLSYERCNAAEICLPPPGCTDGSPCPAVCTGYCVPKR